MHTHIRTRATLSAALHVPPRCSSPASARWRPQPPPLASQAGHSHTVLQLYASCQTGDGSGGLAAGAANWGGWVAFKVQD